MPNRRVAAAVRPRAATSEGGTRSEVVSASKGVSSNHIMRAVNAPQSSDMSSKDRPNCPFERVHFVHLSASNMYDGIDGWLRGSQPGC